MKRLIVFATLILILAIASVSASASLLSIVGKGIGIPISFWSETKPTTGKIVFVDQMGRVLTPADGMLAVPDNAGVVTGYIIPDDADRVNKFEIRWGLTTISNWDQLNPTGFDPSIAVSYTHLTLPTNREV